MEELTQLSRDPQVLLNLLVLAAVALVGTMRAAVRREQRRTLLGAGGVVLGLVVMNLAILLARSASFPAAATGDVARLAFVIAGGFLGGLLFFYQPQGGGPAADAGASAEGQAPSGGRLMAGLVGVAGAFTIFLIVEVPGFSPPTLKDYVKLLGFSIVGGYGGIAVIRQALDAVHASQREQIGELTEEKRELEKQRAADLELIKAVVEHLDLDSDARSADELLKAVKAADEPVVKYAYAEAYRAVEESSADEADGGREEILSRALALYEAIAEAWPSHYWAFGQIGFLLAERGRWAEAARALARAIDGRAGAGKPPLFAYLVALERALLRHDPETGPGSPAGLRLLAGLRQRLQPSFVERLSRPDEFDRVRRRHEVIEWLARNREDPRVAGLLAEVETQVETHGERFVALVRALGEELDTSGSSG